MAVKFFFIKLLVLVSFLNKNVIELTKMISLSETEIFSLEIAK